MTDKRNLMDLGVYLRLALPSLASSLIERTAHDLVWIMSGIIGTKSAMSMSI